MSNGCQVACQVGTGAVFGYAAAALFTSVNPVAGLYFGGAYGITKNFVEACILKGNENNEAIKTMATALGIIAGIAAGMAACAAFGITLTVQAGVTLAIALVVTGVAFACLLVTCLGCCASSCDEDAAREFTRQLEGMQARG